MLKQATIKKKIYDQRDPLVDITIDYVYIFQSAVAKMLSLVI